GAHRGLVADREIEADARERQRDHRGEREQHGPRRGHLAQVAILGRHTHGERCNARRAARMLSPYEGQTATHSVTPRAQPRNAAVTPCAARHFCWYTKRTAVQTCAGLPLTMNGR